MATVAEIQKELQECFARAATLTAQLVALVPVSVPAPPVVVTPTPAPSYPPLSYFEYSARAGYESRAVGWPVQVLTLDSQWQTIGTTGKCSATEWTRFKLPAPMAVKGWRVVPPVNSNGNLRVQAFDTAGQRLTGELLGDKGNHSANPGWTVDKALNGKLSDMYDAPNGQPSPFGYMLAPSTAGTVTPPVVTPVTSATPGPAPVVTFNEGTRQVRIETASVPKSK